MKRIFTVLTSLALAAGASLVAAPAANAAPTSFGLPAKCGGSVTRAELKAAAAYDTYDLKYVDVHPNKGKEYVFTTLCTAGDWGAEHVVAVTNAKGKLLAAKTVVAGTLDVKSASKKKGVKLTTTPVHYSSTKKVGTWFDSTATFKYSAKAAKFKYTKATRPSWVAKVATFTEKADQGKTSTALGGSKALKSKYMKNVKTLNSEGQIFVACEKASGTKLNCELMANQSQPVFESFEFSLKKSGKKWNITKVSKITAVPLYGG